MSVVERGAGRDGDGVDAGLKHRVGAGPLRLQGQESADTLCSVGGGASGTVTEGDPWGHRVRGGTDRAGPLKDGGSCPDTGGGGLSWAWTGDTEKPSDQILKAQACCVDAWGRQAWKATPLHPRGALHMQGRPKSQAPQARTALPGEVGLTLVP